jgi:hypothetical protein
MLWEQYELWGFDYWIGLWPDIKELCLLFRVVMQADTRVLRKDAEKIQA